MTKKDTPEPLIDIVDQYNQPTGQTSTINNALAHGLWHRGSRVILYTPDSRLLIQRRSINAIQNPYRLSIGANGFVDAGETPEQAAIRETREETGITLKLSDIEFISLDRQTSRWQYKDQSKISNHFAYSYIAQIDASPKLIRQPEEVDELMLLSLAEVEQLLNREAPRELGELVPQYRHLRRILKKTVKAMGWQTLR